MRRSRYQQIELKDELSLQLYPETQGVTADDFCAVMYRLDLPGMCLIVDPSQSEFAGPDFHVPEQVLLLATHGHFDHIAACDAWRRRFGAELAIHSGDAPLLTDAMLNGSAFFGAARSFAPAEKKLADTQQIMLTAGYFLSVIHCPGHSRGSVCLLLQNAAQEALLLFSGDTLFCGSVGRSDLPGGDPRVLAQSLNKLKKLAAGWPAELPVYSGHGPATTMARELRYNPWLNER